MKINRLFIAAALAVASQLSTEAAEVKTIETPRMKVYLPDADKATGRAVLACPGGAYIMLSNSHEGHKWAPFFNDLGIAYAVVDYNLPKGNHKIPVGEAQAAMKVLRDSAEVWHLNPKDIGIMGSSAGGHLASTVATHYDASTRPDFQILFYPVITMDKSYTHMGSHDNLLGENASPELEVEFSNEKQVTPDTPRASIAFSDDDNVVSPLNGTSYYNSLHKAGVPAVLHIYPSGGHGWGCLDMFRYHKEMVADLTSWLSSF